MRDHFVFSKNNKRLHVKDTIIFIKIRILLQNVGAFIIETRTNRDVNLKNT